MAIRGAGPAPRVSKTGAPWVTFFLLVKVLHRHARVRAYIKLGDTDTSILYICLLKFIMLISLFFCNVYHVSFIVLMTYGISPENSLFMFLMPEGRKLLFSYFHVQIF